MNVDPSLWGTYAGTFTDWEEEGVREPTTHEVVLPMFSPAAQQPTKRYRTIVADPPWRYKSKLIGLRGATDYPTMTQDDLLGMPVSLWAGNDSHLYLWTTDAFMMQAHQIAATWGFEVKNILVWGKGRNESEVTIGVGFYFRHACEFVLFGVRGSQSVKQHNQPNIFFAPRTGHSEKPAAFYDMVERMSPGPYLDVFARKQRFGWDTWGNEAFDFRTHGIWHNGEEAAT